jgi:hypothetical protein
MSFRKKAKAPKPKKNKATKRRRSCRFHGLMVYDLENVSGKLNVIRGIVKF